MESLHAFVGVRRMGMLTYNRDRLAFEYDDSWRTSPHAFPLSLSMPLTASSYSDAVVRPFIWGLLPDNDEVLRRWGQRFHVSARNPFRLLAHVGEECAGAVQFLRPQRAGEWESGAAPHGVDWLSGEELAQRIAELVTDHAGARRAGDEGHFSLAGAQPKTGLFREPESGRWGIPKGATPTTHLLKPATGRFEGYVQNEHFCLRLAGRLGLSVANSWTEIIGDIPVIVIERFDRMRRQDGTMIRIHQEDACQALGKPPTLKYQNDGGPSARDLFQLIRDRSSRPGDDVGRFLDALIFNWLISGTDAHAKNYGFLLAEGSQVRLSPLYDLSSALPYPVAIPPQKAKLAMKIGGTYRVSHMGGEAWEKAAGEWKLDRRVVMDRVVEMTNDISNAAIDLGKEMSGLSGGVVEAIVDALADRETEIR